MELLKFAGLTVFCLLFPVVLAAEAQLDVEHIGYGQSTLEVHILIKNTGSVALSDIAIFDNGAKYKTIEAVVGPGMNIEEILYLTAGEHKIEVSSGGAYDSLELTAVDIPPNTAETTVLQQQKQMTESYIWIGILAVVVIVCMVFFLAFRRPKL